MKKKYIYHLQHPCKTPVQLRIDSFYIAQSYSFIKQHFIERSCKTTVNVVTVKNGDAYDPSGKVEIRQVFWIYA